MRKKYQFNTMQVFKCQQKTPNVTKIQLK